VAPFGLFSVIWGSMTDRVLASDRTTIPALRRGISRKIPGRASHDLSGQKRAIWAR